MAKLTGSRDAGILPFVTSRQSTWTRWVLPRTEGPRAGWVPDASARTVSRPTGPNAGHFGQPSVRESVATMVRGSLPDRSSSPVGVPDDHAEHELSVAGAARNHEEVKQFVRPEHSGLQHRPA